MSEKTVQSMTREHNYGIDILRLLSMFYVVVLHTLGHGGVLEAVVEGGAHYRAGWALEIIALVAVDIFVLISGYVANTSDSAPKTYSRYLSLWFEVVFYSSNTQ